MVLKSIQVETRSLAVAAVAPAPRNPASELRSTTMDPNYSQEVPQFSVSHIKYHLPYFTPAEVDQLADKQRGRLSVTQEEKIRQQACGFIEAVGAKIGLYVLTQRLI